MSAPNNETLTAAQAKARVLEAFDTLFNQRNYEPALRLWSPDYIQHSAHIPPGREGLFNLVRALPSTLRYDYDLATTKGNYVFLHGRFFSQNTGTLSRTKPPAQRLKAACRCSRTVSPTRRIDMITTGHKHDTVPTQSIEADGIRYAYRRFGKPGTTPLVFIQHRP